MVRKVPKARVIAGFRFLGIAIFEQAFAAEYSVNLAEYRFGRNTQFLLKINQSVRNLSALTDKYIEGVFFEIIAGSDL